MAGGVGGMGAAVAVATQWVVVLSSRVVLGGDRLVQALHAASGAVLVRTLSQVGTRVVSTGQISC